MEQFIKDSRVTVPPRQNTFPTSISTTSSLPITKTQKVCFCRIFDPFNFLQEMLIRGTSPPSCTGTTLASSNSARVAREALND